MLALGHSGGDVTLRVKQGRVCEGDISRVGDGVTMTGDGVVVVVSDVDNVRGVRQVNATVSVSVTV